MDRHYPLRTFKSRRSRMILGFVDGVSEEHTLKCLRSWAYWLDDRGKMQVGHSGGDDYIELRKRRWKTRTDLLIFRYRNADATRKFFTDVRRLFDMDQIGYELTLTRKKKRPRALEVQFDPRDPLSPRAILNLAQRIFSISSGMPEMFDLSCGGELRHDATDPPGPIFIPPEVRMMSGAGRTGVKTGAALGRAYRWLSGGDRGVT